MGKITINEFSDSLRDATVQVGEKLGDIEYEDVDRNIWDLIGNQELKTDDKTITGAINELFQSANNGKQLIATAIGEPLSAEDTFNAMSNDINGLLATFKTNMMNNGVVVESNDKFKQLIDKIATMAGDNSGKGIQYATGSFNNYTLNLAASTSFSVPVDIGFIPTLFILSYGGITSTGHNLTYYLANIDGNMIYTGDYKLTVTSISDTQLNLDYFNGGVSNMVSVFTLKNWYAIGVGEEDTTLRDSLASILEGEGIEVSEEDDMASLITKVDEEFDRKNEELANSGKGVQFAEGTGEITVPADGSNVTYNLDIDFDATLVIVRATFTDNDLPSVVDRLRIVDSRIHNSLDTGRILVSGFSNVPICYIQGNTIIATSGIASSYSWNYTLSWIAIG